MAVLTLLMCACGPPGSSEVESERKSIGDYLAGDAAAEPEGDSPADLVPAGYFYDPDNPEQAYRQSELVAQEVIAQCMAEEGFDYIPYAPAMDHADKNEPGSFEDADEEYGLGVSYSVLSQEYYDESPHEEELGEAEEYYDELARRDPNYAIREALSPEELTAYDEALYGVIPDIDYDTMTDEELEAMTDPGLLIGPEVGGCYNEVYSELWNDGTRQAFYTQFGDQVAEIHEQAEADARIAELEANWSRCMSDAGYDFDSEDDAYLYIVRRLDKVGAVAEMDPSSPWDFLPEPVEPGSDTYRAVESILEEEVAIAEADIACLGDEDEVRAAVYGEYEQAFVDDNRAALERFRDENN